MGLHLGLRGTLAVGLLVAAAGNIGWGTIARGYPASAQFYWIALGLAVAAVGALWPRAGGLLGRWVVAVGFVIAAAFALQLVEQAKALIVAASAVAASVWLRAGGLLGRRLVAGGFVVVATPVLYLLVDSFQADPGGPAALLFAAGPTVAAASTLINVGKDWAMHRPSRRLLAAGLALGALGGLWWVLHDLRFRFGLGQWSNLAFAVGYGLAASSLLRHASAPTARP